MMNLKSFLLLALVTVSGSFAAVSQKKVNGITHYFSEVPTTSAIIQRVDSILEASHLKNQKRDENNPDPDPIPTPDPDPFPEPGITLWEIINLAERAWEFVKENAVKVDVKYAYANALPNGVQSAMELENFSPLQYKTFRQFGKNIYGVTVYDVTYSVVHRYGGTYEEQGQYLENVSVIPLKVKALWGYTLNYDVRHVAVANIGTKSKPIASLTMDLNLSVSTLFKHSATNQTLEFRGDSKDVFILK